MPARCCHSSQFTRSHGLALQDKRNGKVKNMEPCFTQKEFAAKLGVTSAQFGRLRRIGFIPNPSFITGMEVRGQKLMWRKSIISQTAIKFAAEKGNLGVR